MADGELAVEVRPAADAAAAVPPLAADGPDDDRDRRRRLLRELVLRALI